MHCVEDDINKFLYNKKRPLNYYAQQLTPKPEAHELALLR